jgi:hypothetical protein
LNRRISVRLHSIKFRFFSISHIRPVALCVVATRTSPDVGDFYGDSINEIDILWITGGLGCDGDTVAMTAATQPSLEDMVLGGLPGVPKVHFHNPFLAYEVGEEFMKFFHDAATGRSNSFILSNAVKYNRPQGTVTVECLPTQSTQSPALRVCVKDTGFGLSADKIARLFTPFDRLGAELTGVEGTGIGLAYSKRMVTAMGGTLGLESLIGTGSTFWVDLPLAESPSKSDV